MFCPQCKAEYRPGFTHCSDCDVDLVEVLPKLDELTDNKLEKLTVAWSGEDQAECLAICERFQAAGIPFKVDQSRHQFLKAVEEHYKIGVLPEFISGARKIIAEGRLDFSDEPEDQKIMELPQHDDELDGGPQRVNPRQERGADRTTAEVFCGGMQDKAWMVEESLRENSIDFRTEVLEDGSRKIFVIPDDESLAREIVREIREGRPMA